MMLDKDQPVDKTSKGFHDVCYVIQPLNGADEYEDKYVQ